MAPTDVSNAFLTAEISDDVLILLKPPTKLVKMGIVKPETIWKCKKACYGLKEAPKMREEHRELVLQKLEWEQGSKKYYLSQSQVHPSLWYVMEGQRQTGKSVHESPIPEAGRPDAKNWLRGKRVGAVLVYVDDLLSAGDRKVLEAMFKALGQHWDLSVPDFFGTGPDDVDMIRFLVWI